MPGDGRRQGRSIEIVPTTIDHYGPLHAGLNEYETSLGFRWRGEFISAARFEAALLEHVASSWTIRVVESGAIVGIVQILGVHATDRFGELVVAGFGANGATTVGEALLLALDEAFRRRDLRKLYVHLSERSLASFPSTMQRFVRVEGTLREHLWLEGRYQDVTIGVIDRDEFARHLARSPLRQIAQDDWYILGHDLQREPLVSDIEQFQLLLDDISCGAAEPSTLLCEILTDSLAVVEILAALDVIGDREVALDAVLAMATVGELVEFAASIAVR